LHRFISIVFKNDWLYLELLNLIRLKTLIDCNDRSPKKAHPYCVYYSANMVRLQCCADPALLNQLRYILQIEHIETGNVIDVNLNVIDINFNLLLLFPSSNSRSVPP